MTSRKYGAEELFEAFSRASTCYIADAQHKSGVMKGIVPRIERGAKMVGRALTVQTTKGDWAKPVEAIDRAVDGDVLVIDAGSSDIAVFGELAAWSCRTKGVRGVVIDGAVRDLDGIYAMGSRHSPGISPPMLASQRAMAASVTRSSAAGSPYAPATGSSAMIAASSSSPRNGQLR